MSENHFTFSLVHK